jgi:hypothetical protein
MFTDQIMVHIGACVVHALQKYEDLKCYEGNLAYQLSVKFYQVFIF